MSIFSNLFRSKTKVDEMLNAHRSRIEQSQSAPKELYKEDRSQKFGVFHSLAAWFMHHKTRLKNTSGIYNSQRSNVNRSLTKYGVGNICNSYLRLPDLKEEVRNMLLQVREYAAYDADATVKLSQLSGEVSALQRAKSTLLDLQSRGAEAFSDLEWQAITFISRFLNESTSGSLDLHAETEAMNTAAAQGVHQNADHAYTVNKVGTRSFTKLKADGSIDYVLQDSTKTKFDHDIHGNFLDKNMEDQALFPHEPCIGDIHQGDLGDCYLLSALAALVSHSPKTIKDCMHDDGKTVTVRFYVPEAAPKQTREQMEAAPVHPLYVRVAKTIPRFTTYAQNCLWVQMMEKAYTASRLHQMFDSVYASGYVGEQSTENQESSPLSYQSIRGGIPSTVLRLLMGKKAVMKDYSHITDTSASHNINMKTSVADMLMHIRANDHAAEHQRLIQDDNQHNFNRNEVKRLSDVRNNTALTLKQMCVAILGTHEFDNVSPDKLSDAIIKSPAYKQHRNYALNNAIIDYLQKEDTLTKKYISTLKFQNQVQMDNLYLNINIRRELLGLPPKAPAAHYDINGQQEDWNDTDVKAANALSTYYETIVTDLATSLEDYAKRQQSTLLRTPSGFPRLWGSTQTRLISIDEFTNYMMNQGGLQKLKDSWRSFNPSAEFQTYFDEVMNKMTESTLSSILSNRYLNSAMQYSPFSGQYTQNALDFYDQVAAGEAAGSFMTGASRAFIGDDFITLPEGLTLEDTKQGLVEGHGYTILGARTESINNKEVRYILLRNTWSSVVREYDVGAAEDGQLTHKSQMSTTSDGAYMMELNDYLQNFNLTNITTV